MKIPTISATELAFSGFGRGDKTHAIGYSRMRAQSINGILEEVPIAAFIQADDDGVTIGFYIGLFEHELDSTDLNPFRQYAINPRADIRDDDVLQCLGLLESLNVMVQQFGMTAAHIDRNLVRNYKAVRLV